MPGNEAGAARLLPHACGRQGTPTGVQRLRVGARGSDRPQTIFSSLKQEEQCCLTNGVVRSRYVNK